jgi:hypothetical protein
MLKTERGQNKLKGRKPFKTPSGKKLQISQAMEAAVVEVVPVW